MKHHESVPGVPRRSTRPQEAEDARPPPPPPPPPPAGSLPTPPRKIDEPRRHSHPHDDKASLETTPPGDAEEDTLASTLIDSPLENDAHGGTQLSTISASPTLPNQVALANDMSTGPSATSKKGPEVTGIRTAAGIPPSPKATFTLDVIGTLGPNATLAIASEPSSSANAKGNDSTGAVSSGGGALPSSRIMTTRQMIATGAPTSSLPNGTSLVASTTGLSASMSALITSSTPNINAAAMTNSNPPDSSNIFRTDNRLFPLAIVIIVVGILFFLAAIGILWLRLSGYTKKRNQRNTIPTFADGEKGMWDLKVADYPTPTGGAGIASTSTASSTRGIHAWAPPVPPRPPRPPLPFGQATGMAPLGWERTGIPQGAYEGAFFPPSRPPPPPPSSSVFAIANATAPRGLLSKATPLNPFESSHDTLQIPDVPLDPTPAGSPVPSFATERQPHDEDVLPCPKVRTIAGNANSRPSLMEDDYDNGYVAIHRSSRGSVSSGSSMSSYTYPGTARTFARSSIGNESIISNYLATYLVPTAPSSTCPKEEEAVLARLKSAGGACPLQRGGTQRTSSSGGSSGSESGERRVLAKAPAWRVDRL